MAKAPDYLDIYEQKLHESGEIDYLDYDTPETSPKRTESSFSDYEKRELKEEQQDKFTENLYKTTTSIGKEVLEKGPDSIESQSMWDYLGESLFEQAKTVGEGIKEFTVGTATNLMREMATSIAKAVSAGDEAGTNSAINHFIEASEEMTKKHASKPGGEKEIIAGLKMKHLREFPSQLGFSLTAMLAGLGVGIPAGMTTTPAGGFTAGGSASGTVAYRMAKDSFVRDIVNQVNQLTVESKGRELSPFEVEQVKTEYNKQAVKFGLWEAVPEAVGNMVGAGLIGKAGKHIILEGMKKSIPAAARAYAGGVVSELATETVTQVGQSGIEAEVGMRDRQQKVLEALKDVAPGVVLLTSSMVGAGAAGSSLIRQGQQRQGEQEDGIRQDELREEGQQREGLQPEDGASELQREEGQQGIQDDEGEAGQLLADQEGVGDKPAPSIFYHTTRLQPTPSSLEKEATKYKSAEEFVKSQAVKAQLVEDGTAINNDGTVTLYHATTKENAKHIEEGGQIKGGTGPVGGMTGADIKNAAFFGTDEQWTKDTWGGEGKALIKVNVPAEFIRKGAQNKLEVYFENGLKKQGDIWVPNTAPKSTFYDKVAEETLVNKSQLTDIYNKAKKPGVEKLKPGTFKDFEELKVETKIDKEKLIGAKSTKVSPSQLPVGEGKKQASRLAERMSNSLTNLGDSEKNIIPEYQTVSKKENLKKAADYVLTNPNEAIEVLRGKKTAPKGLLNMSIAIALQERAISTKDASMIADVASLQATRMGQEISILSEVGKDSPIRYVSNLTKRRIEAFGGNQKVAQVKKDSVSKLRAEVKKTKPTRGDWASFIRSVEC